MSCPDFIVSVRCCDGGGCAARWVGLFGEFSLDLLGWAWVSSSRASVVIWSCRDRYS
jgi:hypothetical protein